jgi:hypothetical protein
MLCRALMDAGRETRMLADNATLSFADALGMPTAAFAGTVKRHAGLRNTASALASIANANGCMDAIDKLLTIKLGPPQLAEEDRKKIQQAVASAND